MPSDKFKWLTQPGSFERPSHDIVVMETADFAVLPSVGALTDHWFIVVPKRAIPTLSEMTQAERLDLVKVRRKICEEIKSKTDCEVFEFEHGGVPGSLVSCGVDQAHLHIVGLQFNLLKTALHHDLGWRQAPDISQMTADEAKHSEYLFVQSADTSFICNPKVKTSQWFRQVIAMNLGVEIWDYKARPNLEKVYKMAARYRVLA